jgi:hypothetical protein
MRSLLGSPRPLELEGDKALRVKKQDPAATRNDLKAQVFALRLAWPKL